MGPVKAAGLMPPRGDRRRRHTSQQPFGNSVFHETVPSPHPRSMLRLLHRNSANGLDTQEQSSISSTTASQGSQASTDNTLMFKDSSARPMERNGICSLQRAERLGHTAGDDKGSEAYADASVLCETSPPERCAKKRKVFNSTSGSSEDVMYNKDQDIKGAEAPSEPLFSSATNVVSTSSPALCKPTLFGLPSPFGVFKQQLFDSFLPMFTFGPRRKCSRIKPTNPFLLDGEGSVSDSTETSGHDVKPASNTLLSPFFSSSWNPNTASPGNKFLLSPSYTTLPDLIAEELGGRILFCTDEFFGPAAQLLNGSPPAKNASPGSSRQTDGWETSRKRTPGHHWCIIQLGVPGCIHGVELNMRFINRNYAPYVSVEAAHIPDLEEQMNAALRKQGLPGYTPKGVATAELGYMETILSQLLKEQTLHDPSQWRDVVPMHPFAFSDSPITSRHFVSPCEKGALPCVTHLRVNLFPDGGLARLRVYGVGLRHIDREQLTNLASVSNGAVVIGCSYEVANSSKHLLLDSVPSLEHYTGWLTDRNPGRHPCVEANPETGEVTNLVGEEWVIIKLACRVEKIVAVEVDTACFIGDYPERVFLQTANVSHLVNLDDIQSQQQLLLAAGTNDALWSTLLPETRLGPNANHYFRVQDTTKVTKAAGNLPFTCNDNAVEEAQILEPSTPVTHIKMTIFPDGGVARLRVWGYAETKDNEVVGN